MPSYHLRQVFDPERLRKIAAETERIRVERGAEIVVVRGLSGTLVASAMSAMFATPFAVARKVEEYSHGGPLELVDVVDPDARETKPREYRGWIIVDDLISSGRTIRAIAESVHKYGRTAIHGRCSGIVLYHSSWDSTFDLDGVEVPVAYIRPKIEGWER